VMQVPHEDQKYNEERADRWVLSKAEANISTAALSR
jgi:hypothetical protein